MIINKKSSLLTFISTAALLALFNNSTSQTVHADTVKGADVVQTNNQNNKETQKTVADSKTTTNNVATQKQNEGVRTPTQTTTNKESKTETNKTTTVNPKATVNTDKAATNTTATEATKTTKTTKEITPTKEDSKTDTTTQDLNNNTAQTDKNDVEVDIDVQPANEPTVGNVVLPDTVHSNGDKVNLVPSTSTSSDTQTDKKEEPKIKLSSSALEVLADAEISLSSLTKDQIEQINKIDFKGSNPDNSTKWTYAQYAGVANKMLKQNKKYRVPYFNAKLMKNMPALRTRDAQTGKVETLEIWDAWPVQDAKTMRVANYKGYQLMIAMMGIPKQNDAHIYLLYNKYNDNNFSHWKTAGAIFGYKATPKHQEWSGSATVNKNGTIQLFYTDVDTTENTNHQKISTVNLKLNVNKKKNKITIAKRSNRHVIFEGDGAYYQTYDQWKSTNKGADNIAMRDAHVIEVKGRRYLVFEASTGDHNYQGADQIYNWQNYGGTSKEAINNFLKITSNADMTSRGTWANAAIGIIELTKNENNPKVAKVMAPLVTSLMVSDEIERANVVPLNGKYYLFATTRLNRGTGDDLWQEADKQIGDNVAMLGWVSDHLDYGYKPLNGDGTVLVASVPFNWRTSTYSYYAVPVKGSKNELLVNAYMTNRGMAAGEGKISTLSPSFIIKVNGDKTSVVQKATNQGDWVYDKKSVNKKMLVKTIKGAHLKGEPTDRSMLKTQKA
ncbi:glycoside hydrolase family 68 protein [Lactobacillus sp. LL6]|uniref:glycoside hydrolase family 68 protein n=1 Tax=Lactobacillus sp. LL6 TaxID=2596827 RepID=UPI0011856AEC|nr:glycoside hydrolase family 68 protein [Lactobacillus sp. LL6]TSO25702.1 levansucrase [Lactobacillus sp. LL6]